MILITKLCAICVFYQTQCSVDSSSNYLQYDLSPSCVKCDVSSNYMQYHLSPSFVQCDILPIYVQCDCASSFVWCGGENNKVSLCDHLCDLNLKLDQHVYRVHCIDDIGDVTCFHRMSLYIVGQKSLGMVLIMILGTKC